MRKRKTSIASIILSTLSDTAVILPQLLPKPFETKYTWARRLRHLDPDSYRRTINRLKEQGYLKAVRKNGRLFVELTKKGQLEALLAKIADTIRNNDPWDGNWRVVMFDIPESSKEKRSLLRRLLKKSGFVRLQASVYVSPYSFSREAVLYLKQKGFTSFIRMMKVDEMDEDKELRKKFNLK